MVVGVLRRGGRKIVINDKPLAAFSFAFDRRPDADVTQPSVALAALGLPWPVSQMNLNRNPSIIDQTETALGRSIPTSRAATVENARTIVGTIWLRITLRLAVDACHFLAKALRARAPAIAVKRVIGIVVEGDLNACARIRLPILSVTGRNQRDL